MWNRLADTARRHLTRRLRRPAWVLLVELFIGVGWLRAAIEKVVDPDWWSGDVIRTFVVEHEHRGVGWYRPIAVEVWMPFAAPLALIVLVLQSIAALTLVTGRRTGLGLTVGMVLNLHFVLGGAVDPSIFYLVCQAALALRLLERRRDAASGDVLEWWNLGSVVLVCTTVPMIRTLHPTDVIADPAIVLATFGALTFLATATALARRAHDEHDPARPARPARPAASVPGPAGDFRSADSGRAGTVTSLRE